MTRTVQRLPMGLLAVGVACAAALSARLWLMGRTPGTDLAATAVQQFVLLLVSTPVLMTLAGLAYVAHRRARLRSTTNSQRSLGPFRLGIGLLVGTLVVNWVQLYLQWPG